MVVSGRVQDCGAGCCAPLARPREHHRPGRHRPLFLMRVLCMPATRLLSRLSNPVENWNVLERCESLTGNGTALGRTLLHAI